MKISFNTSFYLTYLLLFSGLLFWSVNKGFDFADEGFYLILSNANSDNFDSLFNYNIFFKFLNQIFGFSFGIVELRILRLILYIICFSVTIPILKKYNANKEEMLFFLISFFSCYSYFTQSASYNTFAFFFTYLNILIYIYVYILGKWQWLITFLGLFPSFCFMGKPTVGLLLLLMNTLIIVFYNYNNFIKILILSFILVSLFFFLQYVFHLYDNNYSFFNVINNGSEYGKYDSAHSKWKLITNIIGVLRWLFILILCGFILAYIFIAKKNFKYRLIDLLLFFLFF